MLEPFTSSFFRRLQQLKIHTRKNYLGSKQGIHLSLRRGHGLEFADYRAYTPGDDFRHIDWGVFGRTDRLYVRQFREEQDLNVIVILDASASMGLPQGENKFELSRDLALALGYIGLSDGDSVMFSVLGQKNTPRYRGHKSFSRALADLRDIKPQYSFDFVAEVRAAIARQKIPGKCFLISDFLMDLDVAFQALDYLRFRNFDISVIQVLSPTELSIQDAGLPGIVVDAESGEEIELDLGCASVQEYASLLAQHVAALERYCSRAGILHIVVSSNESLSDVVLTKMPVLGLLD